MEEILREILQAITRYSANAPQLPVNDALLFAGSSHVIDWSPGRSCRI